MSPAAGIARCRSRRCKRGDVTITVTAKGELPGGNSEMLSAPMTGGGDMAITFLREPGRTGEAGDVVVKFDTTEQEFKLKEAEADLAEAEQQVIQAQADNQAKEEETRYALLQAKADVRHGGAGSAAQSDSGGHRGARKYAGAGSRARTTCGSSNTTSPTGRPPRRRPWPFRKPRATRPR